MSRIDVNNKNLWLLFEWGEQKIHITESMLATWIIMAVLIIFAVIVRIKLKSFKDKPSGFQNVVELIVETFSNLVKNTLNEKLQFLGGWFFTVFTFILVSNYSGLFSLRPPTSDLATTLPLAVTTFVIIHVVGIKYQKGAYFKGYLSPFPVFLPMNIIGELAKPISLAFRLFGNILGGLIIMQLIYTMLPVFITFAIPSVLHIYFDLFSGAIQAFVFTILSMTFIQLQAVTD